MNGVAIVIGYVVIAVWFVFMMAIAAAYVGFLRKQRKTEELAVHEWKWEFVPYNPHPLRHPLVSELEPEDQKVIEEIRHAS